MAITHLNRRGKTYYLHQSQTKSGKLMFFFSMEPADQPVEAIPKGYEIYEEIKGQVFLRKITPKLVTDAEVALVERSVRDLAPQARAIVQAKKNAIVVAVAEHPSVDLQSAFTILAGFRITWVPQLDRFLQYAPMMQLVLADKELRTFSVQRWCFRGSIERWIHLAGPGDLAILLKDYCPYLGKGSLYDLI